LPDKSKFSNNYRQAQNNHRSYKITTGQKQPFFGKGIFKNYKKRALKEQIIRMKKD
jgi:hypothetical protein